MVLSTFCKIDSTFASRCLSSTWWGIPTTSTHSFLEYYVFAQHWHSNVTILLVNAVLTCLAIESSDWSLEKFSLKLRISSTTSLFTSDILLCNDIFCSSSDKTRNKFSLQQFIQWFLSVLRHGHDSYKVKVRLLCFKNKILHWCFNLTCPLAMAKHSSLQRNDLAKTVIFEQILRMSQGHIPVIKT